MSLKETLEKASAAFVTEIMSAVRSTPIDEMMSAGGAPKPVVRRGRPPKKAAKVAKTATSARKPGRPPKVKVEETTPEKATPKEKKKSGKWPKCKAPGCTKNAWARGNGLCGTHYKKSVEGEAARQPATEEAKPPKAKKEKKAKAPKAEKPVKEKKAKKEPKEKMAPMGRDYAVSKMAAAAEGE